MKKKSSHAKIKHLYCEGIGRAMTTENFPSNRQGRIRFRLKEKRKPRKSIT